MSVSQTVPSPFAVLLKRSKFASYDPSIGQVYTSYGGHVFRGDWGLKRPLPTRRRPGFITVNSIDSPEQHTEWSSAESSARWMRRWEEIGKKLEVRDQGSWASKTGLRTWTVDSEFDMTGRKFRPKLGCEESDSENAQLENDHKTVRDSSPLNPKQSFNMNAQFLRYDNIPNPDAMTRKQFQKYLDHLRTIRPEFKQFLKEYWRDRKEKEDSRPKLRSEMDQLFLTGSGDIHMLLSAQKAAKNLVTEFLARRAERDLMSPTSLRIGQRPHKLAGLEYTSMSALQSKYLHKPLPGRHIGSKRISQGQNTQHALVAAGGLVGSMPSGTHNIVPTDFGTGESPRTDRERGKGLFRMSSVVLERAPRTVGRPFEKATDTKFGTVDFRVAQTSNLSNPHPLGSPQYVNQISSVASRKGHWDRHPVPSTIVKLTQRIQPTVKQESGDKDSDALFRQLSDMLPGKKNTST